MSQRPIDLLRDMDARNSAIRRYAAAHDKFAEYEQAKVLEGNDSEAMGAHIYAEWCLRAVKAELDDPPFTPFGKSS